MPADRGNAKLRELPGFDDMLDEALVVIARAKTAGFAQGVTPDSFLTSGFDLASQPVAAQELFLHAVELVNRWAVERDLETTPSFWREMLEAITARLESVGLASEQGLQHVDQLRDAAADDSLIRNGPPCFCDDCVRQARASGQL